MPTFVIPTAISPVVELGGDVRVIRALDPGITLTFGNLGGNITSSNHTTGAITGAGNMAAGSERRVRAVLGKVNNVRSRTREYDSLLGRMLNDPGVGGPLAIAHAVAACAGLETCGRGPGYSDLQSSFARDCIVQGALNIAVGRLRGLDAGIQLFKIIGASREKIAAVEGGYWQSMESSPAWPVLRVGVSYLGDLRRIGLTDSDLRAAAGIAQCILEQSGAEFADGPFGSLISKIMEPLNGRPLSLEGILPRNLNPAVLKLMRALMCAHNKLEGWKAMVNDRR